MAFLSDGQLPFQQPERPLGKKERKGRVETSPKWKKRAEGEVRAGEKKRPQGAYERNIVCFPSLSILHWVTVDTERMQLFPHGECVGLGARWMRG